MAKITIFSTKGSSKKVHETEATTWGELKSEISSDYDFNNLQATENVNRADLVASSAVLPKGDFTLFLRPIKTKSGAFTYSEAREIIKGDLDLQDYIKNTYGKNYTNLTTATLNEAIQNMYAEKDEVTEESNVVEDEDDFYDEEDYFFENDEEDDEEEDDKEEILSDLEDEIDSIIESLNFFLDETLPNIKDKVSALRNKKVEVDSDIERLQREAREIFGE